MQKRNTEIKRQEVQQELPRLHDVLVKFAKIYDACTYIGNNRNNITNTTTSRTTYAMHI